MIEVKVKRKICNRKGGSHIVALPAFLLDSMGKLDAEEVVISIADESHILLEVVKNAED